MSFKPNTKPVGSQTLQSKFDESSQTFTRIALNCNFIASIHSDLKKQKSFWEEKMKEDKRKLKEELNKR